MKFSKLHSLILCSLVTTLAISCAEDKNKKDNMTRPSPGSARKMRNADQAPAPDASQTPAPSEQSTTPNPSTPADPAQTKPTDQAGETIEIVTELCRITSDAALTDEQKSQQLCDATPVKTDANGKIEFAELVGLTNASAPIQLAAAIVVDKVALVKHTSVKDSKNAENINLLVLAFELPNSKVEIDESVRLNVKLNNVVLPNDKLEIGQSENSDKLFVRIKDATLIDNINFELTIEYALK